MAEHALINFAEAGRRLADGEVGVIPTDTLYGIVGSALKPSVVERVYGLRHRDHSKPMIILIGSWDDLELLGAEIGGVTRRVLERAWPGPVSVIVPVSSDDLSYLHRGTYGLAFRMPRHPQLREMLRVCGPVVAPSANLEGKPPSLTIREAQNYFGDDIFYVDGGTLKQSASALVDATGSSLKVLRPTPGFNVQSLES